MTVQQLLGAAQNREDFDVVKKRRSAFKIENHGVNRRIVPATRPSGYSLHDEMHDSIILS